MLVPVGSSDVPPRPAAQPSPHGWRPVSRPGYSMPAGPVRGRGGL